MKITCKDASHLISKHLDRELSLRERLALRWHLLLCEACVRVRDQMTFLRKALHAYTLSDKSKAEDSTSTRQK